MCVCVCVCVYGSRARWTEVAKSHNVRGLGRMSAIQKKTRDRWECRGEEKSIEECHSKLTVLLFCRHYSFFM